LATAVPRRSKASALSAFSLVALVAFLALGPTTPDAEAAPCDPPVANEIVCENSNTGNPASEWDVEGAGDPAIQGFATDISVDQGQTVHFKVNTVAQDYRLDIYRLGYYGGAGARKVATVDGPSVPQLQPGCLTNATTGLVDCGNWAVSASWPVPADAVSGIYLAKLVREDPGTNGASHIAFVVRDDDGNSDLLFQTADTTWQAYNNYGGNSLYSGSPAGRAYAVSYNRPFLTRGYAPEDWIFNAEYPMVRWLEQNGYDVSYFTGVDADRFGSELLDHKAFLSVGHDEYWSGNQRKNVELARGAGVNLAFFSGNEVFWKTRWEPSIDGSTASHRTLVSYKETHAGAKIDPEPNVWTGTWRDPRFSPPADGGRPENALTGTIFMVNDGATTSIQVPEADGNMRFWRNTSVATLPPDGVATLPNGTLGYEWDEDLDNGHRPPGLFRLSSKTVTGVPYLQDHGSNYASGTATHALTLYRHSSGALVFGSGTVQWPWGLDSDHDRGNADADPRMQQATVNLFADMRVQPGSLAAGLTPAAASTDTTPPTATVTSPSNGDTVAASGVTITGTATDTGGVVGGVEVSVDGGTTWRRATGRETWSYFWQPGSATTGAIKVRAVDDSGNLGAASTAVDVTVGAAASCPCSIWSTSTAPGPMDPDTDAVEVGVKFRSDVDGFVTGLRFYKYAANSGTHVGHLWASDGTLLAEATFTGETASGWQEVALASPTQIAKDTTYIASYHMPAGRYAATNGGFSAPKHSPPLHALQDGADGGNGVYRYGPSGFPNLTFEASNYWVDLVFETNVGPDTTPPLVSSVAPTNAATGIAVSTNVTATFNETMNATTISGETVKLRDPSNNVVSATVSYNAGTRRVTIDPSSDLSHSATYTATITGGASGVKDDDGNALAGDFTWSFSTAAPPPPPPDEGPGGPILVVSTASNPFTRYFAEILRAEGLNEFTVSDISFVTPATLAAHDVVVLGETALTPGQVTMLGDWVQGGGNLIAMRPDKQLAPLLGLTDAGGTLANSYLLVDTAPGLGAGIVDQTIQYHGPADRYSLDGATSVATLYSNATTSTTFPAVTVRNVGSNGGQAAAFTYDLARSVVYTRQGNPEWAGKERDGSLGTATVVRPNDMFYGNAAGDPQPDWVDLNKVAIPQADEQQRLLANLIGHVNRDRNPLPRFWYFPRNEKAVVVMTGDDHGGGGTTGQFDGFKAAGPSGCSVADWECIRSTSYVYPGVPLNDAQAASYHADGFELGVHVNTDCAATADAGALEGFYSSQLGGFADKYPSLPAPSSNRTHCAAWGDWATQAKVELAHGIRVDTNWYYYPPEWIQNRPGMFTGSGIPMRFADLDGSLIDVYQGPTQMTDESGQSYPFTVNTLLDNAIGASGYYGAFVANMHTDQANHAEANAIVASATARSVPVISARQLLTWVDGRNGSSFGGIGWSGNTLSFTISVGAGANGLRAMVPTGSKVGALTGITRDGTPVTFTAQTIKGVEYAFFPASAGSYEASYAVDATAPVITDVTAIAAGDGKATVTWTTNEPATSRVEYGTSAGSLGLSQESSELSTSHSAQLTGLAPNTTYSYRVTSADGAGNATTAPPTGQAPASFSTPSASLQDTSVADFGAGSPGTDTSVADAAGGEVILKPTLQAEFAGAELPTGWLTHIWNPGGSATVRDGSLAVNGARVNPETFFSAGRSLEFVATFGGGPFGSIGLGDTFDGAPWANVGLKGDGAFYARTNDGAGEDVARLAETLVGAPHRFRIDWNLGNTQYLVDGMPVATQRAIGAQMRPIVSDFEAGGPTVSVDWLRLSPYSSSGTFRSRVLDAGQPVDWGILAWSSTTPAGTAVALKVRRGNNSTPDGSWTSFAPVASSGAALAGNSRYIQYEVDLSTSDSKLTAELRDVTITYTARNDTTPPEITNRSPVPSATGVPPDANVTATFDEPMRASSFTGTSFRLRARGTSEDVPATVGYAGATATLDPAAGLAPGTTYDVTIDGSVEDTSGNRLGAVDTWSFTTAALSFVDTTVLDFGAGTPGDATAVANGAGGEVILKPAVQAEFDGSELPAGWLTHIWNPGGGVSLAASAGAVTIDGARANTEGFFGAGRSLEFVATFGGAPFQAAGLGNTYDAAPWAQFGIKADGVFYARTSTGGGPDTDTPLSSSLIGSAHRFRIDWQPLAVVFYVDRVEVARHTATFAAEMRPVLSDFSAGGSTLSVDWLRFGPYPGSASFISRVLNAGAPVNWGALSWSGELPAGTTLALSVRRGATPTPDASWSVFQPIASSGAQMGGNSRYLQYRAELATSDPALTPELHQVTIGYAGGADTGAPVIVERQPGSAASGVPLGADVRVGFNEPMESSSFTSGRLRLRAQGAGADVAASLTVAGANATLNPGADLAPSTTYTVTVSGSVTDVNGNALGADASWTFTTAEPPLATIRDAVAADFEAGTLGGCAVSPLAGDGELTLHPLMLEAFPPGSALPAGWTAPEWNAGGGASVSSDGLLTVAGARTGPAANSAVQSLEFVGTFGAEQFQHAGLAADLDLNSFAIFSTFNTTTTLYARSGGVDTPIPGSLIGSPHRYKITRSASGIEFFVDGVSVATRPAIAVDLRPVFSDFATAAPGLTVDWLRMTPYTSPCTFTSRLLDTGSNADWRQLTATRALPAGTAVSFETRSGASSTPGDSGWSAWSPLSGDQIQSPDARYLQYRATLSSSDSDQTPAVQDVTVGYALLAAPVNRDPLAGDDDVGSTGEDTAKQITAASLLGNDSDPDGDPLSVSAVSGAQHGSVSLAAGTITFTPEANYHGPASFEYALSDGKDGSDTGLVALTVTPVNDAPVAANDTASVDEDSSANALAVLANDSPGPANEAGQALALDAITQAPAHGSASLGTGANAGKLLYTPQADFVGADSLGYRVCDDGSPSQCASAQVSITVGALNDAPLAVDDDAGQTAEDTAKSIAAGPLVANDTDRDNDSLSVSAVSATAATQGTVELQGGTITYTPAANYNGPAGFEYTLSDGKGGTDTGLVTLSVIAVNDPPVAVADSAEVAEDGSVTVDLRANDSPGPANEGSQTLAGASIAEQPTHGSATVLTSGPDAGKVLYSPAPGYNGPDSFRYQVCDDGASASGPDPRCAEANVSISVRAVNDVPTVANDAYTVNEDATLAVGPPGVLGNDTDADGDPLTASLVSGPSKGILTFNVNGSFTYAPNSNVNGQDSFSYRANDGSASSQATVTLTIAAVNDAPSAVADSATTAKDTPIEINVLSNDKDVEGATLSVDSFSQGANGSVAGSGSGLRYTPNRGFTGSDTFTYKASDGALTSSAATVTVTVTPIGFRASSSAHNHGENTLEIPAPSGLARGDFMLAAVNVRSNVGEVASPAQIVTPAGWRLLRMSTSTGLVQATFYRFLGRATPTSYTWTLTRPGPASGGIVAYIGTDSERPIDAALAKSNSSSTSITAPSITTTVPNTMLVGVFGVAVNGAVTPPAGMVKRVEDVNDAVGLMTEISDSFKPLAGATGQRVAQSSGAARNAGQLIALRPGQGNDVAPSAPGNLTSRLSSVAVTLDWNGVGAQDLDGYDVYRSASSAGSYERLNGDPLTSPQYVDKSAPGGATSYYKIVAVDAAGNESGPATTQATRGIAFRAAGAAHNDTASTLALPVPAGVLAGDLMLASVAARGAPATTAPDGWTLLRNDANGTQLRLITYYRIASGAEPASYKWVFSAARSAAGGIVAYSGVDTIHPVDLAAGRANLSSKSITAPSVTTRANGVLLVGFFGLATSATLTPPDGMLEQIEERNDPVGNDIVTGTADALQPAAGATGQKVAVASRAAVNIGQLVAIRPAGAPPPPG
jgi:N,N-dimethylformamidase beta subunit-like protein/uncharacterized protein DUF4082/cadherin-like protein/Big-like domain-containing protein/purple acid phosphatase-like protein